jgi:hypothetical protein
MREKGVNFGAEKSPPSMAILGEIGGTFLILLEDYLLLKPLSIGSRTFTIIEHPT